jgi:hypothetical protein
MSTTSKEQIDNTKGSLTAALKEALLHHAKLIQDNYNRILIITYQRS